MANATDINRTQRHQRWAKRLWIFTLLGVGIFFLFFLFLSFFTPSFKELEDPNYNQASEVLASNGEVLGTYYTENRVPLPFDSLSPNLVKALIATEDLRYEQHSGIDARALFRVAYGMLTFNSGKGGGSTIPQQLAKLLYTRRENSKLSSIEKPFMLVYYKLYEWVTAIKLERSYTKEEILAMYLNQYNFVNGAYGIKAASEIYFNKQPKNLRQHEAALLIGMLQNASLYNPIRRAERAKKRRNEVIEKMLVANYITQSKAAELKKKELDLNFRTSSHADGLATHFRAVLAQRVNEMLKAEGIKKSDGSDYNIYKDGLKIHTTIDFDLQRIAEQAMKEHMSALQKSYFKVWRGKDPWTYRETETTDAEVKSRKNNLDRAIRQTDRFEAQRAKYLDELLKTIADKVDIELSDNDILNMLEEDTKSGYINRLIKENGLSSKKAAQYRIIMDGNEWSSLKTKWKALWASTMTEMRKPVKMKVFAYTLANERDTTMTPLDSIRYHQMIMQLGSVAIDPSNGHIKTWVGGVNHKYFQYDHVTSNRQVGSTFKPIVYAAAIQQLGISPCMGIADNPQTIRVGEGNFKLDQSWTPKNAKGYSGRTFTLFEALKESVNTVSVNLMKQMGNTEVVRGLANQMGIDSSDLPSQPSICLGACELEVLQMTGAYTTFANQGKFQQPTFLLKIVNKSGKEIYKKTTFKEQPALRENANYVMLDMLKYVTKGAPGVSSLSGEVGGKTGTTNDYVDGWFMGVTPKLVVGTWVGGENRWIRFLNIEDGQGGKMARPFFAKFMQKAQAAGKIASSGSFKRPPGDLGIEIDCSKYRGDGSAPSDGKEFFDDQFSDEPAAPKKEEGGDGFGDEL